PAFGPHARDLDMHFGHQRTCGIKHFQATLFGIVTHLTRDAVSRENHDRTRRGLVQLFNKDRPFVAQVFDHVTVMDDFMTHVNRCAVQFQGAFDNINRAVDPSTESTGLGQNNLSVLNGSSLTHYRIPKICTSRRKATPAKGWLKSNKAVLSSISLSTPE